MIGILHAQPLHARLAAGIGREMVLVAVRKESVVVGCGLGDERRRNRRLYLPGQWRRSGEVVRVLSICFSTRRLVSNRRVAVIWR